MRATDDDSRAYSTSTISRRALMGSGAALAVGSFAGVTSAEQVVWGMIRGVPQGSVTCDGNSADIYPNGYYEVPASDGDHTLRIYNKNGTELHSTTVSVSGDTRYDKTLDLVRGAWRRPPSDLSTMKDNIDTYFDYGVTDLYIDTFYHGMTIYPSSHTLKKDKYSDTYLSDVIAYAHDKGMRIHAKIDSMYWWNCKYLGQPPDGHPLDGSETFTRDNGNSYQLDGSRLTLTEDGEWESEGGKNFASAFCDENVQLIEDVAAELDSNYDVDGIQLDYIRFPKHDPAFGWGDCSPATPSWTESDLHPEREDAIDNLAKQASKQIGTWTIASVAVFPEYYMDPGPAEKNKSQDWKNWGHDYDVDWDVPMCYKYDAYDKQLQKSMDLQTWAESVMPGLAITDGHDSLDTQYDVYNDHNFGGYTVWKAEEISSDVP